MRGSAPCPGGYMRGSASRLGQAYARLCLAPRSSICEALPRAPLRTFFEKKVLRTPKNFLLGQGKHRIVPAGVPRKRQASEETQEKASSLLRFFIASRTASPSAPADKCLVCNSCFLWVASNLLSTRSRALLYLYSET